MKPSFSFLRSPLSPHRLIQTTATLAVIVAGSTAQATEFYKANNTSSLNVSASWENLAGVPFVDPTKPTNTSATSDTDIWYWDNRVLAANTSPLGNDLRVKTITIKNPGGPVTIDGVTNNRSITVISGGGIDMSAATQDLTIQNLSTSTLVVGLRISSSGGNIGVSIAANRTLTMLSKITAASNAAGTNSTVNFTGPGTMICNAEMMANRLNIASGEVQLNLAGGSARPGTGATPFTNVNGGRLIVNNTAGSATGTGPVNVKDTATLTGQGIMTGLVTVESGGTIIPKENAVGSLTAGSLTLAAGSKIKWEAVDTSQADIINTTVSGGLTLNGGTLELYNAGTATPFTGTGTYNLFSYSGAIGGSGISSLAVAESSKIPGQTYTFGVTATNVTLTIEVGARPQSFWNVDADGTWATPSNWTANGVPNAMNAIANLGGTSGVPITAPRTVTLGAPATVGVLNFDSAQPFTLTGDTLTFDDDTAAKLHVENGSHLISAPLNLPTNGILASLTNAASTLTVQGVVNGDGGIAKSGPGTLILTEDNLYYGVTSNSAGVLQLGTGGATGSLSGLIANSGTLRFNRSTDYNQSRIISGSGGLDLAGTGTITLSTANTFSGPTTISAGALEIKDNAALQNSTLTYSSIGGTLKYADGYTNLTLGGLTGDKSLPLTNDVSGLPVSLTVGQNNASTSYTGSTTGGAGFTKAGTGTLSLSGTHLFSGATNLSGGVLSLNTGADFTSGAVTVGNASGSNVGIKLRLNGGTLHSSGDSTMYNSSAGFEIAGGIANFSGKISNLNQNPTDSGGSFINVTGGTLNAGSMTLTRGSLSLTAEPTSGQTANGLYINGGAVNITGALNIGNGSNSSVSTRIDSGSLTVEGATIVAISNSTGQTRWNVLDIAGGVFTSTDTGTGVRLGGASTVASNVVMLVRGGVAKAERIQFGVQDALGNSVLNLTGGSLYVGAGGMVLGSTSANPTTKLQLSGGVLGATGDSTSTVPVSLTGAAVVTGADALDAPHTVSFSGSVTGTGSLTKNGSGSVSFTSPNTAFSGIVTVNSGTLGLGGQTGAVGVASGSTLVPRGTLSPQAASTVNGTLGIRYDVDNLLLPGRIHSQGTLTLGAGSTLDISGTGTLTAPLYILASGASGISGTFGSVTGTVPSGYTLNTSFNNASGFPVIALVSNTASPYDLWASIYGLSGTAAETNADPDNDGLQNLLEFGLGSNPSQSSPGPVLGRIGDFLTLTFPHIADPNLVFSIEASESLTGTWNTVHTFPVPFNPSGTSTYTDNVAIGSTNHRFIRLAVTSSN